MWRGKGYKCFEAFYFATAAGIDLGIPLACVGSTTTTAAIADTLTPDSVIIITTRITGSPIADAIPLRDQPEGRLCRLK
jgi:hypothetical protein